MRILAAKTRTTRIAGKATWVSFSKLALALALSSAVQVNAATIHVTATGGMGDVDFEDNGNCSLLEASLAVALNEGVDACEGGDPSPTVDTIVLPPNTLFSSTDPYRTSNRMVSDLGDGLIIEGNGSTLERAPGAVKKFGLLRIVNSDVTLRNLTLRNGDASDSETPGQNGGAVVILSAADVLFENVQFIDNRAIDGGAIHSTAQLAPEIRDSLFRGNVAENNGGAIAQPRFAVIQYAGGAFIANSVFEDNQAEFGGALWIEQSRAVIVDSTLTGNSALIGGAMYMDFSYQTHIVNSTVSGNTATLSSYGGIYGGLAGEIILRNSTVSGNFALEDRRGFQIGIFGNGALRIDASTVLNASFPSDEYPVAIDVRSRLYYINSSLIGGCNIDAGEPENSTLENNWFIYESCDGVADGDPQVGPLQDNGGPTLTYAPLDGSPLIDNGGTASFDVIFSPDLVDYTGDIDQRGLPRPPDAYDIGSVEVQPPTGFDALTPGERAGVLLLLQRNVEEEEEEEE